MVQIPAQYEIYGFGAPEWLPGRVIMLTVAGSRLYGTNVPGSDWDLRGVCVPPREYIYGIRRFEQYHSPESDDVDLCVYSLHKFISLAAQCNPNIVEILWSPLDKHVFRHPLWDELYAIRDAFLSKVAFKSFSGYAMSQLRKAQASYQKTGSYDSKNAMHLVRLMRMGVEILRDGEVNVARPDAEYLLSIRRGEVSLDQVIAEHDALYEMLRELRDTSGLPDGPDYGRINAVVVRITEAAVQDRGGGLGVEIDEERRVAEALAMIKKVRIPDSQLEQLGMDEDWADTVSPEFVRCVINVADRRKALLKKLSAE